MAPNPESALFTQAANSYLHGLQLAHARNLSTGADDAIRHNTTSARVVRRAVVLHAAIAEITSIPSARRSDAVEVSCAYLRGAAARMQAALRDADIAALHTLSTAAQSVLDDLADGNAFEMVDHVEFDETGPRFVKKRSLFRKDSSSENLDEEVSQKPKPGRSFCGLSCQDLSKRDKLVLWLYIIMVLGALVAITAVTVDFVRQQINPGSFIRSEVSESLPAPVVTVCLSQRGIPFSRLQLFNFTDAQGRTFLGATPNGPQTATQGPEFESNVERFWDNPNNENCNAKVGDFFPFAVARLNDLTSGRVTTACRPCYRVGAKQLAISTSTSFQDSSVLAFWTDNYFLQCMKSPTGLNDNAKEILHQQIFARLIPERIASLVSLSSAEGQTPLSQLGIDDIRQLDGEQLCNVFYLSIFPIELENIEPEPNTDIRYEWDGEKWNPNGRGPYFRLTEKVELFPEDSLQMFVGTNRSTATGRLQSNSDMILIGPNTQTYATFRPVIVYDEDRYDISSSTTNLRENVLPFFGYWLRYRIFYNYVRFVTDEWYRESTYPVSQWIVDFTGYATLFTGASLFSLLLLPLLRTMRRREKQRLLKQSPEVYLWSKHRRKVGGESGDGERSPGMAISRGIEDDGLLKSNSVMLPGYNV